MDAAAATGWYGPLIDLADAPSHVHGFVQLLVFIHTSQGLKNAAGMTSQRSDLSVGDDTLPYFFVTTWKKYRGSMIAPGSFVLLQNVKIEKHKDAVLAILSEISSVRVFDGQYDKMQGNNGWTSSHMGNTMKDKLKRVIEWVRRSGPCLSEIPKALSHQGSMRKNWVSQEHLSPTNCLSISEVLHSTNTDKVVFHACIGEILLPDLLKNVKMENPKYSICKGLSLLASNVVEDIICFGCKLCGYPLALSSVDHNTTAFYCKKSSDHVHVSGSIYKPFLLHVRDQHDELPILVKNSAAEIMFGNITAEKVIKSYRSKRAAQMCRNGLYPSKRGSFYAEIPKNFEVAESDHRQNISDLAESAIEQKQPDFYHIWLILLKSLTMKMNSPFRFEITVDVDEDPLNGKFELISLTMPCCKLVKPNMDVSLS